MRFPITAIVSILHRLSGILLFLLLPLMLYVADYMLRSSINYQIVLQWFQNLPFKIIMWILGCATIYHIIAGIRHLLLDAGYFDSKRAGTVSSQMVIIISFLLSCWLGVYLW